ncbi:hypothetical protein E4P41_16845 [Geodermatophilus sp. DF01-2]|uniref:hypothetical protein n=1 Tax=Geodermatophilus sp. DF01-2 TaxID=2559610 RepID=UPI0010733648|nr:hypothetical protein [Geodermatophilus sp. DF01_2]TFV55692.1 hypothetical protein E4P41_16845 [Geodermatophilus sp. DF01_2]
MASNIVDDVRTPGRITDLVRWGPVVAGVVIALGFFALMNALWLALAYSVDGGDGWVSGNIGWFIGVTAAVALMLAGFLAGYFSGPRGAGAGVANGLTAWGLLFILSLTALIPGAVNLTTQLGAGLQEGQTTVGGALGAGGGGFTVETALWVSFWSLLAGLVLAAVGGLLGGKMRRPVVEAERESRNSEQVTTAAPARPATGATVTENYVVEPEPVDRTREVPVTTDEPPRRR